MTVAVETYKTRVSVYNELLADTIISDALQKDREREGEREREGGVLM